MAVGAKKGTQERVSQTVGLAMGAACGMTIAMLRTGFERQETPAPRWLGPLIAVALLAAVAFVPRLRREPRVVIIAVGIAPIFAMFSIVNLLDVDSATGARLRGVGFLVSVAVLYALAFAYSRRKREVDQLIFREASLFAFFATVIAAISYGTLVQVDLVPDVPLVAVAIFGQFSFTLGVFIFDRKYA
jgi:hypothetical protein